MKVPSEAMSLLNPHDWRLDSDAEGVTRVHHPPIPKRPELRGDYAPFECLRCGSELYFAKAEGRQQP